MDSEAVAEFLQSAPQCECLEIDFCLLARKQTDEDVNDSVSLVCCDGDKVGILSITQNVWVGCSFVGTVDWLGM